MPDKPGTGPTPDDPERLSLLRPGQWMHPLPRSNGWGALNTLISGILGFTLLGWLAGRAFSLPWLAMIGMFAGAAAAMTVIWFRYGTGRVESSQTTPAAQEVRTDNTKENR